jgi:hypothetical protein
MFHKQLDNVLKFPFYFTVSYMYANMYVHHLLYIAWLYFSNVCYARDNIYALQCKPIFFTFSSMLCMPCLLLHFFHYNMS